MHTLIFQVSEFHAKWADFTAYVEEHLIDVDRFMAGGKPPPQLPPQTRRPTTHAIAEAAIW